MLSTTVANGFKTLRNNLSKTSIASDTQETEKFCQVFDQFFDIFNTRSLKEADRKLKPNLKPIELNDIRFKVNHRKVYIKATACTILVD